MDRPVRAIGAGFIWGALPCGMVYSAVAIAVLAAGALDGALVMLAFWLGTLPALLALGAGAGWLLDANRRRWFGGTLMVASGFVVLALLALQLGSDMPAHHAM